MLMYKSGGITERGAGPVAAVLLALIAGVCPALSAEELGPAFEGKETVLDQQVASGIRFSSPLEAYRQGKAAFDEGWYGLALPALRYAANKGVFGARLKLAKMYELGLGVPRNDAAAFYLYEKLSEKNWNISTYHPAAPYIGQALAALGAYHMSGIDKIDLKPDVGRASRHFIHAAQYFGDPRAQYELARMYLSGNGVEKNPRRAISWLSNATKKKYAPAQALLGQLLWEGEMLPRKKLKALALLTMAQENAGPQDSEWISELYKTIVAETEPKMRKRAKAVVARWVRIYSTKTTRSGKIVIRKEVRIGVAERADPDVERDEPQESRPAMSSRPRADRGDRDRDLWMGVGSFREIETD